MQNKCYIMYIWPAYLIFLTGISRKSQNSNLNYIMKNLKDTITADLLTPVWGLTSALTTYDCLFYTPPQEKPLVE